MKRVGFILSACLVAVLCFLGWQIYAGLAKQVAAEHNIQILPDLHLHKIKEPLDTVAQYLLLAYFSPSCEHCQNMAVEIYNSRSLFSNTNISMITSVDEQSARKFMQNYHLDELPFLSMSIDTDGVFYKNFQSTAIPSFYLYNKRRHLVVAVKGETKLESLLDKTK